MRYISAIFLLICLSCTYLSVEELVVDCTQNPILAETISTNADCGVNNGAISIEATGGKMPYDYQLGDFRQTDPVFSNLEAGTYQIIITDANGCTTEQEATVLNNNGVQATATTTNAGCEVSQGKIVINASLGQSPYSYSINNGITQSSNEFSNLGHGIYTILVKDALGCEFTLEEQLFSDVSYKQSIEPIMTNSCAVTGCHNGSQFPDLRSIAGVQSSSEKIKIHTQSGFMPLSGSLTQAQKDAIACWVDDGALNN